MISVRGVCGVRGSGWQFLLVVVGCGLGVAGRVRGGEREIEGGGRQAGRVLYRSQAQYITFRCRKRQQWFSIQCRGSWGEILSG